MIHSIKKLSNNVTLYKVTHMNLRVLQVGDLGFFLLPVGINVYNKEGNTINLVNTSGKFNDVKCSDQLIYLRQIHNTYCEEIGKVEGLKLVDKKKYEGEFNIATHVIKRPFESLQKAVEFCRDTVLKAMVSNDKISYIEASDKIFYTNILNKLFFTSGNDTAAAIHLGVEEASIRNYRSSGEFPISQQAKLLEINPI